LDLAGTEVTDAGLRHIKELTSLEELRLVGSRVTRAGLADLKRVMPSVRIRRD